MVLRAPVQSMGGGSELRARTFSMPAAPGDVKNTAKTSCGLRSTPGFRPRWRREV